MRFKQPVHRRTRTFLIKVLGTHVAGATSTPVDVDGFLVVL
jgi:hypothetical protein